MNREEYLKLIDETIANGRYKADWSSLSGHEIPSWYYEAKFGIFIHWGVYSVPAYACEWYPRWMYNPTSHEYEFHKKNFGDPSVFGYKDFIPMFRGEKFDAGQWVELFKNAGAKYVMPVAEHHDGFAMQAQNTLCRSQNTTTGLLCTARNSTAGTQQIWVPSKTSRLR